MTGKVIQCALDAGAVAAAFAACVTVDDEHVTLYHSWLGRGAHAGMEYMEHYGDIRRDPALLLEGARSILCCAFPYAQNVINRSALFADFAVGDDYHEVLRRRLTPVAEMMQALAPDSRTRICARHRPPEGALLGVACRPWLYRPQQPANSAWHRVEGLPCRNIMDCPGRLRHTAVWRLRALRSLRQGMPRTGPRRQGVDRL